MVHEQTVFITDNELMDLHNKTCFLAEKFETGELYFGHFISAHNNVLGQLFPEVPKSTGQFLQTILLFRYVFKKIGLLKWVLTGESHKIEEIISTRIPSECGTEIKIIYRIDPPENIEGVTL